jgi:nitroreductase
LATTVVVVLNDRKRLQQLQSDLAASQPPLAVLVAVGEGEMDLEAVDRLNPAATRRQRQRAMARWLIPFGFLAGLTFTYITDLDTLAFFGPWSQHLFGALLGLGSGWMGSFAAAASVSSEEDDRLRSLRNRLEEGSWLLLAETRPGAEMPWRRLQQAKPQMVVRLGEG